MTMRHVFLGAAVLPLMLGGCAVTPPSGPSVMVLPGPGKTFNAFQVDDYNCRAAAGQSIGYAAGATSQAAQQNGAASAVGGTLTGAAAGAAIGAAAGNAGEGAAIGAASGLALGAASGAANAQASQGDLQWHYDVTYGQCMAAKGNSVPPMPPAGAYGYTYSAPYGAYPGYGYFYPPVTFSFGWGGWYGGGYHGGWHGGGWHGGGWHGGGWHGGGWHGGGGSYGQHH